MLACLMATYVHSGFNFSNKDADAPAASPFDASGNPKINVDWDFVHRWSIFPTWWPSVM